MNEEEYYIPTIEEFHIGFECEATLPYGSKTFIPIVMKGVGEDVIRYHKENVYRVKYLDGNDIESLGFKPQNNYFMFSIKGEENEKMNLHFALYFHEDQEVKIYYQIGFGMYSFVLFKGKVKNKSQFKRLLKQLEILNNE
jgi:hypothetical protein